MLLQSGFNQNNNRGRGRNGNPRGHGRGFNNFGPNFGFNNGKSSSHPTFGFHNGSFSRNASNPSQFSRPQSNFQVKNGSGTSTTQVPRQNFLNSRPTCQICGKNGHIALDCYHRMNFAYQCRHAPAKLTSMVASSMVAAANFAAVSTSNRLTDTGGSDHVTPDLY